MRRRLLGGIGANLYGQAASVLIQLATVPLLLTAWGAQRYGSWMLLSSVPAALAFADGGLVLASGNAMAMLAGRGETQGAAALFRRALRRVSASVAGFGLAALLVVHGLPADVLPALPSGDMRLLLDLLLVATLLSVVHTLPAAALRAGGAYALSTSASTTLRLTEAGMLVGIALAGFGLEGAAAALVAARLAATPTLFGLAWRQVPWLRQRGTPPGLPALGRPALAALLLPACFALGMQGITLAIGLSLPPASVAAFAAARTLARTLVQAVGLVVHALMPEMSRATGRGDGAAVATVLRLRRLTVLAVLLPGWALLLTLGPAVFAAWTGGRLPLPAGTLPCIATAAALHGLWLSRANLLLAVNRHGTYAGPFLLVTLATVGLAALLARGTGLPGVAAVTMVGEAVMALYLAAIGRRAQPLVLSSPGGLRP